MGRSARFAAMQRTLDRGAFVAIAIQPDVPPVSVGSSAQTAARGVAFAAERERWFVSAPDVRTTILELNEIYQPRFVWWDRTTAQQIAQLALPLDRCWDILTVHRLIHGGWRTSIGEVWASLNGLSVDSLPSLGQMGLLDPAVDDGHDSDVALQPDGHIRPEWIAGAWAANETRLQAWAALALDAALRQIPLLAERELPDRALSTARSESCAELLCAELEQNGLPIDVVEAERIIRDASGRRTNSYAEEDAERARRDAPVFAKLTVPQDVNLRNPGEVKDMLRREGLDLEDTRAWRLEQRREEHPIIDELLRWRKDERIATTYGYRWLDDHVRDGRLRGEWTSSDGAAGRMTASNGLHNLPTEMRTAVAAAPDHVFVRSDLGQVEPRVLAAVSGDPAFVAATQADDLYQTVADRLRVERQVAKLAVLGAMYGATTGQSAHALPGLQKNYPIAMGLLERAAADGQQSNDIFTVGGRRIGMGSGSSPDGDLDRARSAAASRGRFARNALIQGAAAEFFKVWAITVRRRARAFQAEVVLCLHDELLVHAPTVHGEAVAALVEAAIHEAAHYWSPDPAVRFVADVSIISRWSEAK